MASSTYHNIALQGAAVRGEALADAALTPGHLLEINTDEEVLKHATADGAHLGPLVALESPTADPSASAAIDTAYAAGDTVYYAVGQPGDVYYMSLAANQTAVKGISPLVSNGDGTLKVAVIGAGTLEGALVGVPAVDKTTAGAVGRVLVRIV